MGRTVDELERIAAFADALPAAIWVGRASTGECVYVNREFERILGITPPEDASRGNYVGPYGVHTRTGEPYPESEMPFERVMKARAPVMVDDLVIHRHDGGRTYLRVFARPLFDARGEIEFVLEAFIDITAEVEARAAQREGERQLQMAQRLEAIGSLAGGVAHDFNNLLSIVQLVSGHLRRDETNPVKLELLRHLDEVSASASKLTRALLGFARRGRNAAVPVDINELATNVTQLVSRTFDRRIVVSSELSAAPVRVKGDASQLEQVLMNLLINARDAIAGAGRIVVRTRRQTLAAGEHPTLGAGDYVVLEVEDTGTGVPPEIRDRIFEPYVTSKSVGPVKGTGLGLATVYGVARGHDGHAEIGTTGPTGTVMRVILPFTEEAAPETARRPSPQEVIRGSGPVLVVDDDPLVLKTAALALEGLGYRAVPASSGADAVSILEGASEPFTAVVLDLTMPGMTGTETYHALREVDATLPVVIMSGAAMNEEAQELIDAGVGAVLSKPFDAVQLSRAIARAVEARRRT